jgi:hypothetical protein
MLGRSTRSAVKHLAMVGALGATLGIAGPVTSASAALVGPVIITTAPSSFINTNNQVSAWFNFAGGQVAIP